MTFDQTLDQIVNRLNNLPPIVVNYVTDDRQIEPLMQVGQGIVQELIITEVSLQDQVQAISGQIQFWARTVSCARRVVVVEQRKYRQWCAQKYIQAITPPLDEKDNKSFKKPTEEGIKALYRTDLEYTTYQERIEAAEEALSAAEAILEGFKAKLQTLKLAVTRDRDNGLPRLSV